MENEKKPKKQLSAKTKQYIWYLMHVSKVMNKLNSQKF